MLEGAERLQKQRDQVQFLQDLKDKLTRDIITMINQFEKETALSVEAIDIYRADINRLGGHAGESQLQNVIVRISI